ncbi:four helix bundle protein [bacterium]|nr:four helix bundle protein [bacterium]
MSSYKIDLSDRLLEFAAAAIRLSIMLEKSYAGRYIAGQMLRSASSAGANYEEACGAESRADSSTSCRSFSRNYAKPSIGCV